MFYIAADPNTTGADIAVYDDIKKKWYFFCYESEENEDYPGFSIRDLYSYLYALRQEAAVHFICENQYIANFRPGASRSEHLQIARDALEMAIRKGEMNTAAKIAGCAVYSPVEPSKWKAKMLGPIAKGQGKKKAKAVATEITGQPIKNHNVADAACIATYMERMLKDAKGDGS